MKIESFAQERANHRSTRAAATRFGILGATALSGFRHLLSAVAIIETAVGIAQLAEHRTVAPTVAGSIPVSHPRIPDNLAEIFSQ